MCAGSWNVQGMCQGMCVVQQIWTALLSSLGLQQTLANFERAGATVGGLRGRAQAEPQALQKELGDMGLKMGQRQKMITALLNHLPT